MVIPIPDENTPLSDLSSTLCCKISSSKGAKDGSQLGFRSPDLQASYKVWAISKIPRKEGILASRGQ